MNAHCPCLLLIFLNCVLHLSSLYDCLPHLSSPGDVFKGYYKNNPPGVYFSFPVLLSLLWALLKAGMVSGVFSVLSVSLAHKIVVSVAVISLIISRAAVYLFSPVEGRELLFLF